MSENVIDHKQKDHSNISLFAVSGEKVIKILVPLVKPFPLPHILKW